MMSHPEQRLFVSLCRKFFGPWFAGRSVLEIGSLNINGTVRDFFSGGRYLGIDIGPGPGVDVVADGSSFSGPSAAFDVVISCECLEHDVHWRETFLNGLRMLKPDGIMVITCATYGRKRHGTSDESAASSPYTSSPEVNYYRNLGESDLRALGNFDDWFGWHGFFVDHVARDLYFLGLGRSVTGQREIAENFSNAVNSILHRKNVLGAWE